jgi:hypothetical protein
MTEELTTSLPAEAKRDRRLAILLAMAMFVLVVDCLRSRRSGSARPPA